jgi:hypothetical protein
MGPGTMKLADASVSSAILENHKSQLEEKS